VVFYGVLWAEGANDVLANVFHVPLYTVTWGARVLVIAGPVAAFALARRACLGLQRRDRETLAHGVATGIVAQTPEGGFSEVLRPASERERAVLAAGTAVPALSAARAGGAPGPGGAGLAVRLRAELGAAFAEEAAPAAGPDGPDGERPRAAGPPRETSPGPDRLAGPLSGEQSVGR